jgi:hypothetical protein
MVVVLAPLGIVDMVVINDREHTENQRPSNEPYCIAVEGISNNATNE